jgi:CubicO group peptidase (beta-lactamase class C family)
LGADTVTALRGHATVRRSTRRRVHRARQLQRHWARPSAGLSAVCLPAQAVAVGARFFLNEVLPMFRLAASVVTAVAVVLPAAALAQHNDRFAETLRRPRPEMADKVEDRVNAAFRNWLHANNVANAALIVTKDSRVIGHFGYGERSPDVAVPVASLSKAITGVCIASLVDGGRLSYQTRIASALRKYLTHNHAHDVRASNITIEQLLRHQSGLERDSTQGGFADIPNADSSDVLLARRTLGVTLASARGTRFFYNNVNYALLGLVIQEVTGEPYEAYCRRVALAPRGAPGAHIGAGIRAMGAFGGWEISASEYAQFARAFDPRQRLLSPQAQQFINTGAGGRYYALGINVVRTATGRNLFHFGDWNATSTTPRQFGAFFASWDNGVSVVANYDIHVPEQARGALDNTLRNAAYGR